MNIYTIVLIILVATGCLNVVFRQQWVIFVTTILLALFAGLRATNIGPDTISYYTDYWLRTMDLNFHSQFESGYSLLVKIFVIFNINANTFFLLFAFLTLSLLGIFFHRYSYLPIFSLAYYYARFFLTRDMNQIRQSLAAAILLFSLKYMAERDLKRFTFIVLIASLFHSVALIMFVPYVLINYFGFKSDEGLPLKYGIVYIASLITSLFITPIITFIFNLVGLGTDYLTASVYTSGGGLLNPVLLFQSVISFFLAYIMEHRDTTLFRRTLYKTYMVGTLILLLLNQYRVLAGRTSTVLVTVEAIVVIDIIKTLVPRGGRTIVTVVVIVLTFFLISESTLSIGYLPYATFLN